VELEAVLAAALDSGLLTPALAMDVLRDAVATGRVPPDPLRRLGLEEAGDPTVARPVEPSSESVHSVPASPVAPESISTGQLLGGRYRLERKLGEGGMGVVYLASDQEVEGEIFAIKVLTAEIRERPDALELLREEVRKTRTLAHPNIVGVYSLNVDRSGVFILMECLEGKTLQGLLDEDFGRGMRFDRAWPLIEDLGAALAYAHDHSVIHGDLKPANVFVTTSGRAKLLDFGIARAARGSRWGKDAAALGALTPAYASCEMLEYLPPDTRDDIYALACIIYEMLSGKHPFDRHNAVEARDAGEKPTPIAALTARQNAALAQGLAFKRAASTATVEMLLAGLAPAAPAKPRAVFSRATGVAALIISLAVVLAYLVADRFWFAKHRPSEQPMTAASNVVSDKSIAVLPFADLSERHDEEYFADGVAEQVLDLLARIPGLKVIGRTSSFQFKGSKLDARSIGKSLGVAHLLEGSVRRSGDTVRVTAQLISTTDGSQEWSETYESKFDDVLKVQDAIASGLARALQIAVGDVQIPLPHSINAAAYDLFLKGMHAFDPFTEEGCQEAIGLFTQSLQLDPKLAPAAVGIAWAYDDIGQNGWLPTELAYARARASAIRALELDPTLGAAHTVLADVHLVYDWDWVAAQREIDAAFSSGGRTSAGLAVAARIAATTDPASEKAATLLHEAIALDPLNAEAQIVLGYWVFARTGRFSQGGRWIRRGLEISPDWGTGHYFLAIDLLMDGHIDEAIESAKAEKPEDGQFLALADIYYTQNRSADSDASLAKAIANNGENWASGIAMAYAWRGEADKAMQWLERAYAQHDEQLYMIKGEPQLRKLEKDQRYQAFLRKMNLPD
jgi:serine/threonine-protein kinase